MNNNNTPRKLDARLQIILGIVFLLAEVFFILLFIRSDMSPERIILGIIIFYFGLILLTLFGIKIPETVSNVLWFV
ncbi:hypothetical protein [Kurthia zopfii]|uniref:hypothetical protein n=1 Tax=Kurthia zopfii TaxID=1650 RepID=UPI000F6E7411|nr:hypothetical protein [Kurthia zopfii]VEI06073.1 Uncharacterised protein [Kurthia zopfii]